MERVSRPPKLLRTDLEAAFQAKVIKFLRSKGCFVWKCHQDSTTQAGVADLFFCYEGFYGFIELKKSKTAKRRLGQKEFIEKMDTWSWARVVYPEIWGELQKELEQLLK